MACLFICSILKLSQVSGQVQLPVFSDSIFPSYYLQRTSLFESFPATNGDIVFLGNSITDGGEWVELFQDPRCKNRGISGDVTAGVIHRLPETVRRKPAKIFLLIGTNDLARGISTDSVLTNLWLIADYVEQESPETKLFIQSILPVNEIFGKFGSHTKNHEAIRTINDRLQAEAKNHGYQFVDIHTAFSDKSGKMDTALTNDGLHLKGNAYLLWKHLIFPYVYDLEAQASLVPQPQQCFWGEGVFQMEHCKYLIVRDAAIEDEAKYLQNYLKSLGWSVELTTEMPANGHCISLEKGSVMNPQNTEEAYHLDVQANLVKLTAPSGHGIFNGIQTIKQLLRDGVAMDVCKITDWPAFSWRAYMIDVGRNYMSLPLLKEQIDVMASLKFNVFHFHPTEDVAWRIESKVYPQLTAPENMLRNKGMYYSESEIQELITFCKARHITFVPEIDMPGHSAAFRRAMKTDMQSDTGLTYIKNILKEFCETYDVPYIHIGADEVNITNHKFLPEVSRFIATYGRKLIGWQPGGDFSPGTIRQMWMRESVDQASGEHRQFIDSRHLYLNHMDPLEAPVTIYNRSLGDKQKGDSVILGATICMWHDRAVSRQEDILVMNPVYPSMLAFAERSWLGGGNPRWISVIEDGDKAGFAAFENRMLDYKKIFLKGKPFPYVKQSNQTWKLYGPYDHGGDLSRVFDAEEFFIYGQGKQPLVKKEVIGGTIVLRHWWAPQVEAALDEAKEQTTWYASTQIWSEQTEVKPFWIDFNNLSRSPATDSPPAGAWDDKHSAIWLNGEKILPPVWKRGGQAGNSEIPLIDEGYAYRSPSYLALKKGWNTVLVKAPVGSFKGKDWQNPVKWMFTFIETPDRK